MDLILIIVALACGLTGFTIGKSWATCPLCTADKDVIEESDDPREG